MKMYEGVEILFHSLTLAPDGGEWMVSRPGRFNTDTNSIGGCVGLTAGLDATVNTENSCPIGNRTPDVHLVAQSLYWLSYQGFKLKDNKITNSTGQNPCFKANSRSTSQEKSSLINPGVSSFCVNSITCWYVYDEELSTPGPTQGGSPLVRCLWHIHHMWQGPT
jgi:hypothetical protein